MLKVLAVLILASLASAKTGYRLPGSVVPSNYKLELIPHIVGKGAFTFGGNVVIQVTCLYPTQNITLHSKDLDVKENSVSVKDAAGKNVGISKFTYEKENDFFIVHLANKLSPETKYDISITFNGKLSEGLAGFYRSSYTDKKTGEKKWLATTQFEATDARRAFPCFDEPAMKATFEINIGRLKNYTSLSNMPIVKTEPIEGMEGWVWDKYEKSVPMSTYLVAFIVSDFDYKGSKTSNNVAFRIWARKDAIDQVEFAKEVGPKALDYYERFFDVKYPLPKQDMIAIPDFSAGAMENWGLVTYREAYLLYDPKISSSISQHSVASVIAHELAHQWFGNLVTMKWWTDLWLNEGFATYMAGLAVHHLFPQWHSLKEEAVNNMLDVFSFDSLKTSHPVSVPVGHPSEIDEIFDTISYKKGSFLIRMMGLFLGEETLRRGVSNYLQEHKYNNAEQDDLWSSLTVEAHKNGVLPKNLTVKTIMDTWTLQTGFPIINVKRDYQKSTAEISQERFLRDNTKSEKSPCWWVPLSYTTQKELNFNSTNPRHWLSCPSEKQTIEIPSAADQWVIFNIQVAGIYKINYDEKNWELLTNALNSDDFKEIDTLNRVQLIDDASDIAWVGQLKYNIFFKVLDYLKQEEEYLPWKTALSNIGRLDRLMKRTASYGMFRVYMKQLLTSMYEKVGGLSLQSDTSDRLDIVKRQTLIVSWSCKYDVANCVSGAKELFERFQEFPEDTEAIPKDLRRIVYCSAVRNGGQREWDFLWNRYQKSNVATEKSSILGALGCTKEVWLLSRYLEWSLDEKSGVRRQDSATVFANVAATDIGFHIAKSFLMENIKQIHKYLSPNTRRISRYYLKSLANQISTDFEYEQFESFIKNNKPYFSDTKQGVEQALETARLNVQWQKKHKEDISKILEDYVKNIKE